MYLCFPACGTLDGIALALCSELGVGSWPSDCHGPSLLHSYLQLVMCIEMADMGELRKAEMCIRWQIASIDQIQSTLFASLMFPSLDYVNSETCATVGSTHSARLLRLLLMPLMRWFQGMGPFLHSTYTFISVAAAGPPSHLTGLPLKIHCWWLP